MKMKTDLYKKIKVVKGENFVTIEDSKNLAEYELIRLINDLMNQSDVKNTKNINILVESKFSEQVDSELRQNGFKLHDENVTVRKELDTHITVEQFYPLKTLNELRENEFKTIWQKSMEGSLNAPSSLNIDEQMRSVEVELGPGYKDSCIVAYEGENPIGVIMPHIEPGTKEEGRIFYFGLIPEERGKGKSKPLHQQALASLKNQFDASYYIGSTSHNNKPMLKTFERNGCRVLERNKVYKRKM
ncbi:GNAT family N-acetyltransferase [Virgibacillus siamensis]|uniref:GNAT family N-acetyltransferase n=2 Tax=Virgibacillus siamensis TaxID=480071 RepID=A0ABP3QY18_9BACI